MKLTEGLPPDRRAHVEARLRGNLIAWLTTVRPDGQPVSAPGAIFGTVERFAELFSVPLLITPTQLWA